MVYHLTYILVHGIYVVYPSPWIFLAFYNQISRPPGPCCWSHSMRTRVWVIKNVLFHAPPWQLCQGIRRGPQKAHIFFLPAGGALPFAAPPAAFAAVGWVASSSSPCPDTASSPPPLQQQSPPPSLPQSPPPSPLSAAAAAAAAMAAARASFLVVSRAMISFLVCVGADCAGPSRLVRMTYSTRSCWRSVGHVSSDMDSRSHIARS